MQVRNDPEKRGAFSNGHSAWHHLAWPIIFNELAPSPCPARQAVQPHLH
jgi:hypothetical protein